MHLPPCVVFVPGWTQVSGGGPASTPLCGVGVGLAYMDTHVSGGGHASTPWCGVGAGLDTCVWGRACIYPPVWCRCRAGHKCLVEGMHLPPCVVSVPGWTQVSGGGPASTTLCGVGAGLAYLDTCVWGRACIYPPVWCQCRAGHKCLGEGLHLPPVWCQCQASLHGHMCLGEGLYLPPCVVSVPGWPTWTHVSGGGPASITLTGQGLHVSASMIYIRYISQ